MTSNLRIPRRVGPYIEPSSLRYALMRRHSWLLREVAENPFSPYDIAEFIRRECIFFHIPKTAGLAVSEALFGNHGAGHITVEAARVVFGRRRFQSYFKFAFVRNPWDRLVSAYHYLRAGHPTSPIAVDLQKCRDFQEFVTELLHDPRVASEQHIQPQHQFVTDSRGRLAVDFVGRFERLAEDFAYIADRVHPGAALGVTNPSRHEGYRTYYSDVTRAIVGEFYHRDIALFGYKFDL